MTASSKPDRGRLVVIEGGDACGKNTQALALHRRLNTLVTPVPAMFFSFPRYNTPLGQAILRHLKNVTWLAERSDPFGVVTAPEDKMVFQCMMTADKYHAAAEIASHLDKGGHVVCDRWWQSAYVYGMSDGLEGKWLHDVHRFLPEADVSVLIDVPAQKAADRRPVARDRYEESMKKREEVRRLYLETWRVGEVHPDWNKRWPIVDGVGDIDEVAEKVWTVVEPYVAEYGT